MKRARLLLGLAALWEVVRFSLLFFLLETGLPGRDGGAAAFSLWFGAPGLMIAVGFAAESTFPGRYAGILPLGILAKAVSVVVGFASVLSGSLPAAGFSTGWTPLVVSLGPVAILGVDILLVLLLVGIRYSGTSGEEA